MSQYRHLSKADPELAAALPLLAPKPSEVPKTLAERRADLKAYVRNSVVPSFGPQLPQETEYNVHEHQVGVDGGDITVRCVVPTPTGGEENGFPLLVWFHGGGFTMGDFDLDDCILKIISVESQIVTVNVDYRLAPEHKFPTSTHDSYAAVKWVPYLSLLNVDLSKGFIVGGNSAGANIATVIAHKAGNDDFFATRKLTGQILGMPSVVNHLDIPEEYKSELLSAETIKDTPVLPRSSLEVFAETVGARPNDPEFAPIYYPSRRGVPPAYFQICGWDLLRDEGFLWEKLHREAGIPTKIDVYPGMVHGFPTLLPNLKATTKYWNDLRGGVKWVLSVKA
ncbi:Alpha/Beta hydrolase protein [Amylocystis lapponica]|nr:Alpha/Beta hydrolase protein [Amylocystis lapponica]